MGKIRDLYNMRVRPMVPAERLELARLILADLAPVVDANSVGAKWPEAALADVAARICSPRLALPEQSKDFAKQVVELVPDAKV